VPSNHEINSGVFVECFLKRTQEYWAKLCPVNFVSNSRNVQGKCMRSWKELMKNKLDQKGKYLMAQWLSGRAECCWRWTTFKKICQGSNKWKQSLWHVLKSDQLLTLRLIADLFNRSQKS
jgi:hypothetical protein